MKCQFCGRKLNQALKRAYCFKCKRPPSSLLGPSGRTAWSQERMREMPYENPDKVFRIGLDGMTRHNYARNQ